MTEPSPHLERRRTGWLLLGLGLVAVAALTFTPIGWALNRLTVRIYVAITYGLGLRGVLPEQVGWTLNVLMFIPLGLALRLLLRPFPALLTCFGLSCLIELAQLAPAVGREASLGDVVANTAGGCIAVTLTSIWLAWTDRHRGPLTPR